MSATSPREKYSDWLSRKMDERGFTIRSLARAWNPENPDQARRTLRRYLNGMVPQQRTREQLAHVLGSPDSEPTSSDDGSEAD